jgi:hypothetical protein
MMRAAGYFRAVRWLLAALFLAVLAGQPAVAQKQADVPWPPADRPWGSADYRNLADSVKSGRLPLPFLASPTGKPVFERIVSDQNVAHNLLRNKDMAATVRLQEVMATLGATEVLLALYLSEAQKGEPYERELAKIMVHMISLAGNAIGLADEAMTTMPRESKLAAREDGLRIMRQGARTIFAGVIQSISETEFFSKPSTLEMARGVVTYLPSFQSTLTDADRQDHQRRIGQQIDATKDAEIKTALSQMRTAIGKPN